MAYAYFGHKEYLKVMPKGESGFECVEAQEKLREKWIAAGRPGKKEREAARPATYFDQGREAIRGSWLGLGQKTWNEMTRDGFSEAYKTRVEITDALRIGINLALRRGYKRDNDLLPDQAEPIVSVQEDVLRGFLVGLMQKHPLFVKDILDLAQLDWENTNRDTEEAEKKYNKDFEPVFKKVMGELTGLVSSEK